MSHPSGTPSAARLLRRSGLYHVRHVGQRRPLPMRYIHLLLGVRWRAFFPIVIAHFLLANLSFGALYWGLDGVEGADGFLDCFFFSVQTMLTIGYGGMLPANHLGDVLVTLEAFFGLLGISMMTGLVFVRVLNPSNAITFSRFATIAEGEQGRALCFRVADQGQQDIARAEMQVLLVERGEDGYTMHPLALERSEHHALALTWTLRHVIGAESPLAKHSPESLREEGCEILASFLGVDSRSGQTVVARHAYAAHEIHWDAALAEPLRFDGAGAPTVDFHAFHAAPTEDAQA